MATPSERIRILYCESNMDGTVGGSHYCLLYLAGGLDRTRFEPIAVFYQEHPLLGAFSDAGVRTMILTRRRGLRVPGGTPKTAVGRLLRTGARLVTRALNVLGFVGDVMHNAAFLRRHRIQVVHLNNSI